MNAHDTYTYDAFGNLLDKTGTTTNEYLYRCEQRVFHNSLCIIQVK